jgi:hypothetical protein
VGIQTTRDINFWEENPRWEATLSNGLVVYSDNQYINNKSDWERLKDFCKNNSLKINNFLIGFRDNVINIENVTYFRRMLLGSFGGHIKHFFVIGTGNSSPIDVYIYGLPDMMLSEQEKREVDLGELI